MHKVDKTEEVAHGLWGEGSRQSAAASATHAGERSDELGAASTYPLLLVELCNFAHIEAAFGSAAAKEVLSQLQLRAQCLGGEVWTLQGATLLVSIPFELQNESLSPDPLDRDWMERWQLWLSTVISVDVARLSKTTAASNEVRILPVVSLTRARYATALPDGESAFSVENIEISPLEVVQVLAPLERGAQWCERYRRDMAAAVALNDGLSEGLLSLDFQPMVGRGNHCEVLYVEALLRMAEGKAHEQGAWSFESGRTLERLGLRRELDRRVVMAVLARLEVDKYVRIGCNLSASSLVDDCWWSSIVSRLQGRRAVAERLTLKIADTESPFNSEIAVAFTKRLRGLGCCIALDEFGVAGGDFVQGCAVGLPQTSHPR